MLGRSPGIGTARTQSRPGSRTACCRSRVPAPGPWPAARPPLRLLLLRNPACLSPLEHLARRRHDPRDSRPSAHFTDQHGVKPELPPVSVEDACRLPPTRGQEAQTCILSRRDGRNDRACRPGVRRARSGASPYCASGRVPARAAQTPYFGACFGRLRRSRAAAPNSSPASAQVWRTARPSGEQTQMQKAD